MERWLYPKVGLVGRDNPVSLVTRQDTRRMDLFYGANNMDYQGGTSKWITGLTAGASWLNFSDDGFGYKVPAGVAAASYSSAATMDYTGQTNVDMTKSVFCAVDTYGDGLIPSASNIVTTRTIRIYKHGGVNNYVVAVVRFGTATSMYPGITWQIYAVVAGVPTILGSGTLAGTHPLHSTIHTGSRKINMAFLWSGDVNNGGIDDPCALYVNGYCIASFIPAVDLSFIGSDAYVQLLANYTTAIIPTVNYNITFRNFRFLPVMLYDEYATTTYSLAFLHDPTILESVINDGCYEDIITYPLTDLIYSGHRFSFKLLQRDGGGKHGLYCLLPDGTSTQIDFEHISPNRWHNNPYINKSPVLMLDESVSIGENCLISGAVYDADDDQVGVTPVLNSFHAHSGNNGNSARDLPSSSFRAQNDREWSSMRNGSGDDTKMDNNGEWKVKAVKSSKESSSKMKNEESYPGVVVEYSELGNAAGGYYPDEVGNGGWPICCNRAPSDHLELYGDAISGVAVNILMESAFRYFRFASIGDRSSDRLKAIFVAFRETAAPAGVPEHWHLQLSIGRITNNDAVDLTWGVGGYKDIVGATSSCIVMHDLPQEIGGHTNTRRLLPDLAIVPIGSPELTDAYRIYWLDQGSGVGTYDYVLKYVDISDYGDTVGAIQTANIIPHINAPATIYNSIYQFDIVQPEAGKFLLVVTVGDNTAVPTDFIEDKVRCITYLSADGINFNTPVQLRGDGLVWAATAGSGPLLLTMAYPKLTCSYIGPYTGEILLGLTRIDCTTWNGDTSGLKSAIFTRRFGTEEWQSGVGANKPWTFLIDCNKVVHECNFDNHESKVLGCVAFRDRHGKLHVAINKVPYDNTYMTDDHFGGLYYAVFDHSNKANQYNALGTVVKDAAAEEWDIVSMSRFAQHNRFSDVADNYNSCGLLRPSFSPIYNDCYFTYDAQYADSDIAVYTDKARDPIHRLFQPTDLGELYPPGPMWNYAMGEPNKKVVAAANKEIWRRQLGHEAIAYPTLTAPGLHWSGATLCRSHYEYLDYSAPADGYYNQRHPSDTVAVKFRFKCDGNYGLPIDYTTMPAMCVCFTCIGFGRYPDGGANYQYAFGPYFIFNSDTVTVGVNPAIPTWVGYLDFTKFRDIYIIGRIDRASNKVYWNIYAERVPDIGDRARWMPKTFQLINDNPIDGGSVMLSLAMAAAWSTRITFGGVPAVIGADACGAVTMDLKFFQTYPYLFKDLGNQILHKDGAATKISPLTSYRRCQVGGPTEPLAFRNKRFFDLLDTMRTTPCLHPAVFQAGEVIQGQLNGMNAAVEHLSDTIQDRITSDGIRVDVGNNTSLVITKPEKINFDTTEYTVFKYWFTNGVDKAFDRNPYTFWHCIQTGALPIRICFDAQDFKKSLSKLAANCIWLLNTNLINARLKANTIPAAWGAPAFETYISSIVDNGVVTDSYSATKYRTLVCSFKNWVPGQFVNMDSPYYVINKDDTRINTGGRIVGNSETELIYELSTNLNGVNFDDLLVGDEFSIVAPSVFQKFELQEYRYWALEIIPNDAGDYNYFCDGMGRIGEIGLGTMLELNEYADVGFMESYKSITQGVTNNDGRGAVILSDAKSKREFDLAFTNVSRTVKNKLEDIFRFSTERNIPVWFLLSEADLNDLMLCDIAERSFNTDIVHDGYNDEDRESAFTVGLKLRERT